MARLTRGEGSRRYDHQYQLRMSKRLFDRIKAVAQAKEQSVNSEIVSALATAFPPPLVPESVNEALFDAASAVLSDWSKTLEAFGQDPSSNPRVASLSAALAAAEQRGRAA